MNLTSQYIFTATLDDKTCPICGAFDGKTYAYDDPSAPMPPLHRQCRCVLRPVIDWKALGIEPPAETSRAAQGAPVAADTSYGQWLRDQPASVQDDILGPTRAQWFRDGVVSLQRLVSREGRTYTLDQLRASLRVQSVTEALNQ